MARAALALPERGRVECFAGSAVGGAVSASTETGGEGEPVVGASEMVGASVWMVVQ